MTVFSIVVGVSCRPPRAIPVSPQSPNDAVSNFMSAVKANDLTRMGNLFGSPRGPASTYMNRDYLNRQLQTIHKYWDHSGYRVIEGPLPAAAINPTFKNVPSADRMRDYRIELQRSTGCVQVALLTVVQTDQGGWLVYDAHLESVGNPAARCQATGMGTRP